ncbi:hypothetical protein COBT_001546 [Conglomerata obtusa]
MIFQVSFVALQFVIVSHVFSAESMEVDETNNIQEHLTINSPLSCEDVIPGNQMHVCSDHKENEHISSPNFVLTNLRPRENHDIRSFAYLIRLLLVYTFAETCELNLNVKTRDAYERYKDVFLLICEYFLMPKEYLNYITETNHCFFLIYFTINYNKNIKAIKIFLQKKQCIKSPISIRSKINGGEDNDTIEIQMIVDCIKDLLHGKKIKSFYCKNINKNEKIIKMKKEEKFRNIEKLKTLLHKTKKSTAPLEFDKKSPAKYNFNEIDKFKLAKLIDFFITKTLEIY